MRALKLLGPRHAEVLETSEPPLQPNTVKIAVSHGGICGSDLGIFQQGGFPQGYKHPIFDEEGPFTLGHEFSGHVTDIGDGVSGVAVGDLVAVRPNVWDGTCAACRRGEFNLCENGGFIGLMGGGGGFSDIVVAPRQNVYVLPAEFTPETGAMIESTAVAWHATKVGGVGKDSTVLVLGAGPVGLGILVASIARGASRVVVSEPSDARRRLAHELGGDVVDPTETNVAAYLRDVTGGAGADVALEASGAGTVTFEAALEGVRAGGTVVIVASAHGTIPLDFSKLMQTEKRIVGSYAYTDRDFLEVIDAIAAKRMDPGRLVSSTISLDQAVSGGFDLLLGEGRNSEVKILVTP